MNSWLDSLIQLDGQASQGQQAVLVTVIRNRGSAPREPGASMVISQQDQIGSIGGGQLEFQCEAIARDLLAANHPATRMLRNFPLGSNCGQCCGGVVDVLFESVITGTTGWLGEAQLALKQRENHVLARLLPSSQTENPTTHIESLAALSKRLGQDAVSALDNAPSGCVLISNNTGDENSLWFLQSLASHRPSVAVFGAGHVGQAVVNNLSRLDVDITWVDSRPDYCQRAQSSLQNGACVDIAYSTDPARIAAALPSQTLCLVMTHSHAQDFEICHQLLGREDIAFCGLIGSGSKKAKYLRLAKNVGLADHQMERLTCPIGISGIHSKKPNDIALSVAAQVLWQIEQLQQKEEQEQEPVRAAIHR